MVSGLVVWDSADTPIRIPMPFIFRDPRNPKPPVPKTTNLPLVELNFNTTLWGQKYTWSQHVTLNLLDAPRDWDIYLHEWRLKKIFAAKGMYQLLLFQYPIIWVLIFWYLKRRPFLIPMLKNRTGTGVLRDPYWPFDGGVHNLHAEGHIK